MLGTVAAALHTLRWFFVDDVHLHRRHFVECFDRITDLVLGSITLHVERVDILLALTHRFLSDPWANDDGVEVAVGTKRLWRGTYLLLNSTLFFGFFLFSEESHTTLT